MKLSYVPALRRAVPADRRVDGGGAARTGGEVRPARLLSYARRADEALAPGAQLFLQRPLGTRAAPPGIARVLSRPQDDERASGTQYADVACQSQSSPEGGCCKQGLPQGSAVSIVADHLPISSISSVPNAPLSALLFSYSMLLHVMPAARGHRRACCSAAPRHCAMTATPRCRSTTRHAPAHPPQDLKTAPTHPPQHATMQTCANCVCLNFNDARHVYFTAYRLSQVRFNSSKYTRKVFVNMVAASESLGP